MRPAVILVLVLAAGLAHADPPAVVVWSELAATPAPADLADILPAGSALVAARSGELLRLAAPARPLVGRLWRSGPSAAFLDESDLLEADRAGHWRYRVPLGAQAAVVVAGAGVVVEHAQASDVGYEWELHEDALVAWGGRDAATPPPPSLVAQGGWREARAAATLLVEAGALPAGGDELAAALALEAVALARPFVEPYYRDAGTPLAAARVEAGDPRDLVLDGPVYLSVSARRAERSGCVPALRVLLDELPVAGGRLAVGPLVADAEKGEPPLVFRLRVPEGRHSLRLAAADGPALIDVQAFRKRQHVGSALAGSESIDARARRAQARAAAPGASPEEAELVHGEALRLRGDLNAAARAFGPLIGELDAPAPARALAAWRLGELEGDAAAAERYFVYAEKAARELPDDARAAVLTGLARARARRAIFDERPGAAAALAAHAELLGDPALAPLLAGELGDSGEGAARLAAALAQAAPAAAAALRRAFFDLTAWSADAGVVVDHPVVVMVSDLEACRQPSASLVKLGETPIVAEIPPDPLGGGRYRLVHVTAVAGDQPALGAAVRDGEALLPVPTVARMEEQKIALAPGRHTLSAVGPAALFLELPPGASDAEPSCARFGPRRFALLGARRELPVNAPAGALVGVELRALDPAAPQRVSALTLEVDGRKRPLRVRGAPEASALVVSPPGHTAGASLIVDLVAHDPRTLRLAAPADARLLVRALVRTSIEAPAPAPQPPAGTAPAGSDLASLRKLGLQIAAEADAKKRARLLVTRARLLCALARCSYAEEDLHAAADLDASLGIDALLAEQSHYVPPAPGPGYAIDPGAALLGGLKDDPRIVALAAAARDGRLPAPFSERAEPAGRRSGRDPGGECLGPWPQARAAQRSEHPRPTRSEAGGASERCNNDVGALALAAHIDDQAGDAAGAAAAYAALARKSSDPRLLVAEAARRLDAAAAPEGPGKQAQPATRAFAAALRAGTAPGAADALARATVATRWRAVLHAERSAGLSRPPDHAPPAPFRPPGRSVRAALAAPDVPEEQAFWLEPGLLLRAVVPTPRPLRARITSTCAELRPFAAAQRGAPPACRLAVLVDGEPTRDLSPREPFDIVLASPGPHSVEVVLAPGGLDVLAGVKVVTDETPAGAVLAPVLDDRRWLATQAEPVELAALGPTVLSLDAVPAGKLQVTDTASGAPLTVIEPEGGGPAAYVVLPDERPYRVAIRPQLQPDGGQVVALAADVREDRARPLARLDTVAAAPAVPPVPPGPAPAAPLLDLRADPGDNGLGTLTVSAGFRDGALGIRDTLPDISASRYEETRLTFRKRADDVWWRVDAFGRLRQPGDGDPSGGVGARAYVRVLPELRFEAGALEVLQHTTAGLLGTTWLDAAAHARLPVGGDFFLVPSLGTLVRLGREEGLDGDGVDPDVWSPYDIDHPHVGWGQVRLDYEPFLDLHAHLRLRAVSNADFVSVDHANILAGVQGVLRRLAWDVALEAERRFADDDRPDGRNRVALRLGVGFSLWQGARSRLSIVGDAAFRPGDRSDAYLGVAWDWTFGRGLADYAPPDSAFAAQLGPYAEATP